MKSDWLVFPSLTFRPPIQSNLLGMALKELALPEESRMHRVLKWLSIPFASGGSYPESLPEKKLAQIGFHLLRVEAATR